MTAWFHRQQTDRDERYASHEEFRQLFDEGEAGFFELAYALTADRNLARECLVSGLEDCRNANSVFREWAHKWARRVIIRTAVRLLREPDRLDKIAAEQQSASVELAADGLYDSPALGHILVLPDFERVVYVLSEIEQYSTKEIALLVGRLPEEILQARTEAVHQVAAAEIKPEVTQRRSQSRLAEMRLAV